MLNIFPRIPFYLFVFCLWPLLSFAAAAVPSSHTGNSGSNPLTKGMVDKGVLSCASRINSMTNFLGNNAQVGAFLFIPSKDPDQHLVSSSLEIIDKQKQLIYASSSFAPNQMNGCGAVYDAVMWSPKSCKEVAKSQFPNKEIADVLKKNISMLDLGPGIRVFLMPAGQGCVSIKKEVVF